MSVRPTLALAAVMGGALIVAGAEVPVLAQQAAAAAGAQAGQQIQLPASDVLGGGYPAPAKLPQPSITLEEAVRLTIRHNPQLGLSREDVRSASGLKLTNTGTFDPLFTLGPNLSLAQQQLPPALAASEVLKRQILQQIASDFSAMGSQLQQRVQQANAAAPVYCPPSLGGPQRAVVDNTNIDLLSPQEIALLGVQTNVRSNAVANLVQNANFPQTNGTNTFVIIDGVSNLDFSDICSADPSAIVPLGTLSTAWTVLGQTGGQGLAGTLKSINQIQRDTPAEELQIANTVATRAQLGVDRLGAVPIDGQQRNAAINAGLAKLFRNGISAGANLQLKSQEQLFTNKPLDPAFGGYDVPAMFQSSATLNATVPLGKGRGAVSVAAPERASDLSLSGQRDDLRHQVATQVLQTVLAYQNLVAAQQTLRLLEESAARQQRIAQLTQNLVTAGDVAGAELGRARARAALVSSSLAGARATVVTARLALASSIGIDVDDLGNAPQASEAFGSLPEALPSTDALLLQAAELRRDTRALAERREAASVLATGARADLRRIYNLNLSGGFETLYGSPFFRYLPDEHADDVRVVVSQIQPIPPPGPSPQRFYSPIGYWRSLKSPWVPVAQAQIVVQLPFNNSTAKGRLAQAQASFENSRTQELDLNRVVRENVISVSGALRRAAGAVERSAAAVDSSTQILGSALQRFQANDQTLIDTLTTEQQLTDDQVLLVQQQQNFFGILARMRFESGDLVRFDAPGGGAEAMTFDPGLLLGRK